MIWAILYLLTALFSLGIAYIIFKSKNGMLRKVMIGIFVAYSLGLTLRASTEFLYHSYLGTHESAIGTIIIVLPLTANLIGFIYLLKNYYIKK